MSREDSFSQNKSPNTYINLNDSLDSSPSPKRPKQEDNDEQEEADVSFLDDFDVDDIINCLKECSKEAAQNNNSYQDIEIDYDESMSLKTDESDENNLDCCDEKDTEEKLVTKTDNRNNYTEISIEIVASSNTNHYERREHSEIYIDKNKLLALILREANNNSINNSTDKTTRNLKETLGEEEILPNVIPISKSLNRDNNLKNDTEKVEVTDKNKSKISNTFETDKINKGLEDNTNAVIKNKPIDDKKNEDTNQHLNVKDCSTILQNRGEAFDLQTLTLTLEKHIFDHFNVKFLKWLSDIHFGKYSDILKCTASDSRQFAVKVKKSHIGFRIKHILKVIQADIPEGNLFSVNLIPTFQVQGRLCFLMDWYPKNLQEAIEEAEKNFHIDVIQELAFQLVTALAILRNKNIVHSDIQPKHILLDATQRKLKLCGFDEAFFVGSSIFINLQGSKIYQAPEVLLGYAGDFGMDVWSAALVLHEMATGRQLFGSCLEDHILNKQICLLGYIPYEMVVQSRFKDKYNINYCVQSYRCETHQKQIGAKKNILARTIHGAYFKHWVNNSDQNKKNSDLKKIGHFIHVLNQMLVLNPANRLPIQNVFSNTFFSVIIY